MEDRLWSLEVNGKTLPPVARRVASSNAPSDIAYECPICGVSENEDEQPWVACDQCDCWFHIYDLNQNTSLSELLWQCVDCQ